MGLWRFTASMPRTQRPGRRCRARRTRNAVCVSNSLITNCGTTCPSRCGSGSAFTTARRSSARWDRRDSQIITAIGDTVNTCARLESLTKEYDCVVVVSRRAAEAALLDVSGRELHNAPVKGRVEPVQFYALKTPADLPT